MRKDCGEGSPAAFGLDAGLAGQVWELVGTRVPMCKGHLTCPSSSGAAGGQGAAQPERGDEAARGTSGSALNLGWWGIPLPAAPL